MIDLETADQHIADLHAATQLHTDTANSILASVLASPVNLAVRVLQAINPDWWPHDRYRQLAAAFAELCATMPAGQAVNVQLIHSHFLNTGALKDGDLKALLYGLIAPGTPAPHLLEPQVMRLVAVLDEWHFRIVWHTIFNDPDGHAFLWPLAELMEAAPKRFDMLRAAYPQGHALEVNRVA